MARPHLNYILFLTLILFGNLIMAHPSWGIVVDKENNIYFADIAHNGMGSVWKLDTCGQIELLLRNFHAHNVSLDKDGNIITAHGEGNHVMLRLNKDGSKETLFETKNHKQFFGGNCTYTHSGEILFSSDHYIWRLLPNGKKEKISDHYFEWNQAVFADNKGNVYAPDKALNGGSLIKINTKGEAEVIASELLAQLDRPRDKHNDVLLGMGVDENGAVYICENAGQRILKINGNNKTSTYYTSKGSWFPTGVYFHNSSAFILEYKYSSKGIEGPQIIEINQSGDKIVRFNYDSYF